MKARPKSLRSQPYRVARDLGNVEAAEKGPASYGKRVVRRKVSPQAQHRRRAGDADVQVLRREQALWTAGGLSDESLFRHRSQ